MGLFSFFGKSEQKSKGMLRALSTISFEELSGIAYAYLNDQQAICKKLYKISSYQNWFYDQTTGKLNFSDNGIVKLIIDYEEIGSLSLETNTWLWAWANPNLEEKVRQKIPAVKAYGEKRDFEKLKEAKWTADETDGWEMAAIASYLLEAKGVYRVPVNDGKLLSFMLFKEIHWADIAHPN